MGCHGHGTQAEELYELHEAYDERAFSTLYDTSGNAVYLVEDSDDDTTLLLMPNGVGTWYYPSNAPEYDITIAGQTDAQITKSIALYVANGNGFTLHRNPLEQEPALV